ncbi:hypothetical protein [Campylobacter sp. MIT 97-5078]|uniref:hypothetical protein n=1 Tax=Campylobacter sp. MIT 97-5078 TaxID=1548153 RepID=UPI0011602BF5|nr:hypothetical protein [Campylobacter sp. MIT 97-5078]
MLIIAMVLLFVNTFLFTEDIVSRIIQLVLVFALVLHDIDEKKWGVNLTKTIEKKLSYMNLNSKLNSLTLIIPNGARKMVTYSSLLINFKNNIRHMIKLIVALAKNSKTNINGLESI